MSGAGGPSSLLPAALATLSDLVAFDTTSRNSNLDLIAHVEATLAPHAASMRRYPNRAGDKTNLLVTIGPEDVEGGVVLSGHTDVVPVDGQAWTSDPFVLTEREGRLYGRGAADMKAFLACAMAAAPGFAAAGLARPIHLAFSYDEEIGCCGCPDLVDACAALPARPAAVIVGEPTGMTIVGAHKGVARYEVVVSGVEAHSSLPDEGVSAIMEAIPLLARLRELADDLRLHPSAVPFEPPFSTLSVGLLKGGTAANILARECRFGFDLRTVPEDAAEAVLAPFAAAVAATDAALRARFPAAGVRLERLTDTPGLAPEAEGAAQRLARTLTGENARPGVVSYGTEAGLFQRAGLSTVVCGPGFIEQAHKPDEFIATKQVDLCCAFMQRLGERMSA